MTDNALTRPTPRFLLAHVLSCCNLGKRVRVKVGWLFVATVSATQHSPRGNAYLGGEDVAVYVGGSLLGWLCARSFQQLQESVDERQ